LATGKYKDPIKNVKNAYLLKKRQKRFFFYIYGFLSANKKSTHVTNW